MRTGIGAATPRATSVRLLTLIGPTGTGKTRLALALAADVADDFPHAAVFVDLAPLANAEGVPLAIAYALGLRARAGPPFGK